MRLLADESLTGRTCKFLRELGHDLLTVNDLGRVGAVNGEVIALATSHHAILVAEDRGFASLLQYPLGSHQGIVVVKIQREDDIELVHRHLRTALQTTPPDQLNGALLIVDRNKFRLRRTR